MLLRDLSCFDFHSFSSQNVAYAYILLISLLFLSLQRSMATCAPTSMKRIVDICTSSRKMEQTSWCGLNNRRSVPKKSILGVSMACMVPVFAAINTNQNSGVSICCLQQKQKIRSPYLLPTRCTKIKEPLFAAINTNKKETPTLHSFLCHSYFPDS